MQKEKPRCFSGGQPPFFVQPLLFRDRRVLALSMGGRNFSADLVLGVAKRCLSGFPQVLLCSSLRNGYPFPTNFWLVCPWLQERCASLESLSGVSSLERHLAEETPPASWIAWHMAHVRVRLALLESGCVSFMRRYRSGWWRALTRRGIGGSELRMPPRVKCLHLQMASYLALGWHPGEAWMRKEFSAFSCSSPGRCSPEAAQQGGLS